LLTSIDRLLQELDGLLLALEGLALLMVEPSKLLENLGVVRIPLEHTLVGGLGRLKLMDSSVSGRTVLSKHTYVLLLLVNMTNLEPNVFFCQRAWRIANDVFETL
jgi:hypothetical protein